MQEHVTRVRWPVKRHGAERYLRFTLLSFAASVGLTRLFLELTGYPQIGGGGLHIAHVLWGGLLLFVAALLPLLLANRWVFTLEAVLSGVGIGLFIDEVGKFITQNNDYFVPEAAPIIYAFFLLVVLLYLQTSRRQSQDTRSELYATLDDLEEVMDNDLTLQELEVMRARLQKIATQRDAPELAQFAQQLLDFLGRADIQLVPQVPAPWERALARAEGFVNRWTNRRTVRAMLIGGLAGLGVTALSGIVPELFASALSVANLLSLFGVRLALESAVAVLLLSSAGCLLAGRDRLGIQFGYVGLLLALTTVDLLVFYFNQFSTILTALVHYGVLSAVLYYRRRYLGHVQAGIGAVS